MLGGRGENATLAAREPLAREVRERNLLSWQGWPGRRIRRRIWVPRSRFLRAGLFLSWPPVPRNCSLRPRGAVHAGRRNLPGEFQLKLLVTKAKNLTLRESIGRSHRDTEKERPNSLWRGFRASTYFSGYPVNQASESRLGLPSLHGCLEFPRNMNLLPDEVKSSPLDIR